VSGWLFERTPASRLKEPASNITFKRNLVFILPSSRACRGISLRKILRKSTDADPATRVCDKLGMTEFYWDLSVTEKVISFDLFSGWPGT
jgi:hypothetical protein